MRHKNVATPYTATYMIFQKEGKIAFVLRENTGWMNGYYGLPAGRVENGENFLLAAARETKEEVGVDVRPENFRLALVVHRNEPDSVWVDMIYEVKEWQGNLFNAEPHVHAELAWLDPQNLPENVVPSVRFFIEHFLAGNNYAEYGWDSPKN